MILIGIGSNVDGPWGTPRQTVERAIEALGRGPLKLLAASRLLVTAPFGLKDQPDYVNAAVRLATDLGPEALMQRLHDIELDADRRRTLRWGPRTLDLDLLDHDGALRDGSGPRHGHRGPLVLPHPGIPERPFVLRPIAEIAPEWRHPVLGLTAQEMLGRLGRAPEGDEIEGRKP